MLSAIRVYRHGVTASVIGNQAGARGDRQACKGWSVASSRANTRFLYSVQEDQLSGFGLAGSFTVRDIPPSDADWRRVLNAFFMRLRRLGLLRAHWIIEWQRRGAPHLHMAMWFPSPETARDGLNLAALVISHWMAAAVAYGASYGGQDCKPIDATVGWLQYLSKHAARGQGHYQRARESLPEGWQKTGRMWGYIGDFPREETVSFNLDAEGWFRYRRLMRSYRKAQARALGDYRRLADPTAPRRKAIRYARCMLTCNNPAVSYLRGVSSWIPSEVSQRLLAHVGASLVESDGLVTPSGVAMGGRFREILGAEAESA